TFAVSGDLGTATPPATVPDTSPATPRVEAHVAAHRPVSRPEALTNVLDGATTPVVARATVPVTLTSDGEQTQFAMTVSTVSDPDDLDAADGSVLALA